MRYIDADALLNNLPDDLPYKASVKRVLIQAPTEDVVEVVRCKDCKYCDTYRNWNNREYLGCTWAYTTEVDPNHYCSYGERGEDTDER